MKYRAEIDGLRAVAVIAVMLFHAGFETFRGGFIGVDVFFVISGYLITTIILTEMEQGNFSLLKFYERRARRILPALFLVMFATLPFAWLWLFPTDLLNYSHSLIAVSTYISNLLFWRESGYWGAANELKPLLHTWSLAVEEQYYIVFPLFLMLMWRFRKRWIFASLLVFAAISLSLAQWGAYNEPVATFFLLPTRGWEIAIGALLSFYPIVRHQSPRALISSRWINEILGLAGLLMIAFAINTFDERIPFPSIYALIPTLGTALIVLCSSSATWVGQLLGTKLLVGIGLISYSAYLWHQPLFAFARHQSLTQPGQPLILGLLLLSFLLAYLSWRFAERPFRNKGAVSRKAIFTMALIGSVFFITIGLAGHLTGGFENRIGQSGVTAQVLEQKLGMDGLTYGLNGTCEDTLITSADCRTSDEPEIVVWGDSFARHLIKAIISSNPDAKVIQMTKSECGPFFDIAPRLSYRPATWASECLEFTEQVRDWLKANNSVKYAVLSSPFTHYLSDETILQLRTGEVVATSSQITTKELATREFARTLAELEAMGITPVIVSPPPTNGNDLGRCLSRADWTGQSLDKCNFQVTEMTQNINIAYDFLEHFASSVRVIRLDTLICDTLVCQSHWGTTYVYRDAGHLSLEGSVALGTMYNFYGLITGDTSTAQSQ